MLDFANPNELWCVDPGKFPTQLHNVSFADLALIAGLAYELQVTAVVEDDDVPNNNTWGLIFIRNAP